MAKDSQIDSEHVREQKANGGVTMAQSALDGEAATQRNSTAIAIIRAMTRSNSWQ